MAKEACSSSNTDEARKSLEHGAVAEGPRCYGVSMGDEMDAPLNGVNAPNWLTHTQLKGNVRHEN